MSTDKIDFLTPSSPLLADKRAPIEMGTAQDARLLAMYAPGERPHAGALSSDYLNVDGHWHYHDTHQLMYAFEGALDVESGQGRHLVPRQLAAWIPAGVPHRISIRDIRSGSVFFTTDMVEDSAGRIRTIVVSTLMREMISEAMRWPLNAPESLLRTKFFAAMGGLCSEWIEHEADLFLPTSNDPRLKRVLNYTAANMDAKLPDVCLHAGMSERSLRRHLKQETGMTWEAYRHRSRLLQAISLLGESDTSITIIAAECGFESPSSFTKAFRLAMNETPRDYRNRVRKT